MGHQKNYYKGYAVGIADSIKSLTSIKRVEGSFDLLLFEEIMEDIKDAISSLKRGKDEVAHTFVTSASSLIDSRQYNRPGYELNNEDGILWVNTKLFEEANWILLNYYGLIVSYGERGSIEPSQADKVKWELAALEKAYRKLSSLNSEVQTARDVLV